MHIEYFLWTLFLWQTPELLYRSLAAKLVVGMPFKVCSYLAFFTNKNKNIACNLIMPTILRTKFDVDLGSGNCGLNLIERASTSRWQWCCKDSFSLLLHFSILSPLLVINLFLVYLKPLLLFCCLIQWTNGNDLTLFLVSWSAASSQEVDRH